jgi:hypothetical protein
MRGLWTQFLITMQDLSVAWIMEAVLDNGTRFAVLDNDARFE